MKKQEQQWHITRQQVRDTQQTNAWLAKQHICADRLADTGTALIQAEARARELLADHDQALTEAQRHYIQSFIRRMGSKRLRQQMKKDAGNGIFRIHTQIKRRLHRQTQ
ncbi:MAG: hypothetical protein EBZ03_12530 [Betaproteobacteria bacterium]|jgi:ABC-type transporter Mla subunit MlaD|nr:hypothetical protein [Betaproteobacteria bacterium]NBQ82582.1 hypothetical protein [Betaproteobacteria bacterium]NCU99534.1 hypothetical protein [Betaproteobacteria bacterium]NCV06946.1 hypothetical protein [Betaproteobacteria bacterium]NCZ30447.1 hypothetical protein [Betaproteobacteria bacterium]